MNIKLKPFKGHGNVLKVIILLIQVLRVLFFLEHNQFFFNKIKVQRHTQFDLSPWQRLIKSCVFLIIKKIFTLKQLSKLKQTIA